ncbi:MAG: plasmid mobilization relaxosome protein MobC [Daejeonella sp.]
MNNLPKGRQKISDDDRSSKAKDHFFPPVRISFDEKELIDKQMELLGIKKYSTYYRLKMFNKKSDLIKLNDTNKLLFELNKIGININQITKLFNKIGAYKLRKDEVIFFEDLIKLLKEVTIKIAK